MVKLTLHRHTLNSKGRFGKFRLWDGDKVVFECDSLEEVKVGTKANSDLAVPCGIYNLKEHMSNKYSGSPKYKGRLLLLWSVLVSVLRCILIHNGNTLAHTLGCILLGIADKGLTGVYHSVKTTAEFYTVFWDLLDKKGLKAEDVKLYITSECEDEIS